MSKISTACVIFALAMVSNALAQTTSVDGCTKNCAYCYRLSAISPPPALNHKSCSICIKSSPKPTSVPNVYDCSGPVIPNCEFHSYNTGTGKPTCNECEPKYFKRKTDDGSDSCVKIDHYACLRAASGVRCDRCGED